MKFLPLFIFWCLWFLNFSARTSFSPILPLIEDYLSLSHGEAGALFASLSIGYSLTLLLAGRFASVWGYKRTVVTGFVGVSLVFLAIQWIQSYLAFHVLFFLLGMATGVHLPSIVPIITETYKSQHWGKAMGIHESAASLSIFCIPFLVAFGLHFLSWRRLLLILGMAALLLPIYFWKVSVEPKPETDQRRSSYLHLLRKRTVWILSIFWIFATASCLGIYSVLPLYLTKERGIDLYFANTLFGISRVGGIFTSIASGFLADRYGVGTILRLSLWTTGLSTVLLSLFSSLPLIFSTLILQATLSLSFFPVGMAMVSKLTPLSERSMVTGIILSIGVIFGMGFFPFLLGLTADYFSFRVGILGLGVLTTLSSLGVRFLKEGIE